METTTKVKVTQTELLRIAHEQIANLEKELATEKSYKEMYSRLNTEKETEIADVHAFLNGIAGVLPYAKDSYYKNKLMTRFASWLTILLAAK
jgi:hypothetical protein